MEIVNFNNVEEPRSSRHHFLLPECHYMLVGPTGCGKTNTLCNMLLQWMCPDKVTIYTINPDQEKYQMLVDFFDMIKEESGDDILDIHNPEDVVPVEDLDDGDNKIIVFDDIKIDKKNMDRVKEYFSLSRNKNCNCIYICQSYYDVPKYIRRNTRCFCLFPNLDNRDVLNIATDHARGLSKDEFQAIYREATSKAHNFMCLDKTAKHIPDMYRQNFDSLYAGVPIS